MHTVINRVINKQYCVVYSKASLLRHPLGLSSTVRNSKMIAYYIKMFRGIPYTGKLHFIMRRPLREVLLYYYCAHFKSQLRVSFSLFKESNLIKIKRNLKISQIQGLQKHGILHTKCSSNASDLQS